jgi:hypothetical protein
MLLREPPHADCLDPVAIGNVHGRAQHALLTVYV